MTSSELPAEVRRFILTSIPSVPFLEAVLLLRGEPARAWNAAQLARRLYVSEGTAADLLGQLRASGIAADGQGDAEGEGEGPNCARYAPEPELAARIDELAEVYARDLVGVSSLIHSRIDRRAQRFADAFRFRKE